MRALLLALALAASASAQVALDVSGGYGGAVTGSGELPIGEVVGLGTVSVVAAPDLPRGLRLAVTATRGAGNARGDGETLAVGVGGEVPLSGGRNGVYLALGTALLDFDNEGPEACRNEPGCFYEGAPVGSYAGLAATVGLGARIPVTSRLWAEPILSAFVWDEVLPSAHIGVGWRIR